MPENNEEVKMHIEETIDMPIAKKEINQPELESFLQKIKNAFNALIEKIKANTIEK